MLEIQKYLHKGNTLEDLEKEFGVYHRIKNGKVVLSYDQIKSPMSEKICQECRGLILKEHTWEIVCAPFFKFHNYGEGLAAEIDWKTARVLEKIDGSNLNLYFCPFLKQWMFSTRGQVEAEGKCEVGKEYSEIAHIALKEMGIVWEDFTKLLNKNFTYMCELVSPYTQIYILYPNPTLYLLAVRDNISFNEIEAKPFGNKLGLPTPKEYPLNDIKSLVYLVNTWNGCEQEGVVVCDKYFNRIKIKNRDYVCKQGLIHSMSCSDRNVIQIVLNDTVDDIIPHCPELIKNKLLAYQERFAAVSKEINNYWNEIKHIENQKEFAMEAKKKKYSSILFNLKKGQVNSVDTFLRKNARLDYVISLCETEKDKI